MKIAVCSMFRNSVTWHNKNIDHIEKYFQRMLQQDIGFDNLDFFFIEGDSTDNTAEKLLEKKSIYNNIKYLEINRHVKTHYNGMVADQTRLTGLSSLGDTLLNNINDKYDYVLWIESDLIIETNLISSLVETRLQINHGPVIVSPFVKLGDLFYDTWAFKEINGKSWSNNKTTSNKLTPMNSVGSCALIDFEIIKNGIRFENGAFINLCDQARNQLSAQIYCDERIIINHPNTLLNNRWV